MTLSEDRRFVRRSKRKENMKYILKPLFEMAIGEVAVCDNVVYNYIIVFIVGEIAFRMAYAFVGRMYREGAISGRGIGSILHWLIRLLIFVIVAYLIWLIIEVYQFVIDTPPIVWWCLLGIVIFLITFFIIWKTKKTNIKQRIYYETK